MARQAFLVLGMHRSGTSAVTRLVNLAGAAISRRLMAPQADNPKGFWESLPITELHDRALAQLGLAWDSIERVPDAWFGSTEAATLRVDLKAHLEADFPHGESFVVKDPRTCRFIPAWLEVLAELRYEAVAIMPVRNPLEVARSLERRNGFSVAKSLMLWLRHTVDAEAATRHVPRAVIDYSRLLEDWRAELDEANRQLGFTCFAPTVFFEEQVSRYLSHGDRHHVAPPDALPDADQHGWVTEAFAALLQLRGPAAAGATQGATATLDRIRASLDDAESVLDPFLLAYRSQVRRAKAARATTEARLSAVEAEARRLAGEIENLEEVRRELDAARAARDEAQQGVDQLRQVLAQAEEETASERTSRLALERDLDEQVRQRDVERQESVHWREAAARLEGQLSEVRSLLIDRAARLDEASARAKELDGWLAAASADRAAVSAELAAASEQLAAASTENASLRTDLASERTSRIRLQAEVATLDTAREQLRRAFEDSERHALRTAALSRAGRAGTSASGGRLRALARLLSDAEVSPSRWVAEPLRSSRNLVRLRRHEYRCRVTLLAASGLFDSNYYSRYIGGLPANLPARFLIRGDAAGERPHVLFDPGWYRQGNPDIPNGIPPLQHYLTTGGWELRSPHPLFDASFYLSQWAPGEVSGVSPLSHFLDIGGAAGVSPHPLFDAFHYLRQRPDVAAAAINPLLHYLTAAEGDAADPHPLFSNRHYLACNPDVAGTTALEHFVRHGAAEGRSPHPLFDVAHYWRQRADVRIAGANALQHFLQHGHAEGVDPHPLFSCRHYESQFAEPWDRRMNPLVHYLRWGRLDFRNPHPNFNVRRYLDAYPDVASSGTDPLLHFVLYGVREGRQQFPELVSVGQRDKVPYHVGPEGETIVAGIGADRPDAVAEATPSLHDQLMVIK